MYCCALTGGPFNDPICTNEGTVFDILSLLFLQKKLGTSWNISNLIKLHFWKNVYGEYHCPILNKVFTEQSNIVAIRSIGNVYVYEAIKELSLKNKCMRD